MSDRLNLVTGATGFSGSYVVRELLNAGERVIATDLPSALGDRAHREMLSSYGVDFDHPNLEWVPSNLLESATLEPLVAREITHVFHTASLYDYSASLERLRTVNVEGTRVLLDAFFAKGQPPRFIHWSTCGVFGKPYTARHGEKVNVPFQEDSPSPKNSPHGAPGPAGTELVNDYSITKWEQEQMMWLAHRERGLPLTVIRPAPIYGPGSSYGHGGIILAIAQGLIPAIPTDTKNFITTSVHAADLARFAVFAASRDEMIGEDYNVVDDSIISYYEFLKYIALLTGRRMGDLQFINLESLQPVMVAASQTWAWLERKLKVPRIRVFEVQSTPYISSSYWLSNRKMLATGFELEYADVREGLKDTVAWFRKRGWLTDRRLLMGTGMAKAS